MESTKCGDWRRLTTREEFVEAFADKPLVDKGIRFTITADGQISGSVDEQQFWGTWYWSDGYFCRTVCLDGEDLGLDCEVIEQCGDEMRYTRKKGDGNASIVTINLP